MRIFVAVDLADRIRRAVSAFAAELASRLVAGHLVHRGGATWVAERNLHLTLRFIGEVETGLAEEVTTALARPFGQRSFDISLDHLGVFPPAGPPRVLWIGVGTGVADLGSLASEVDERLAGSGIAAEQRPFSAHLTLARFKRPPERGLRDALEGLNPPQPFGPSVVEHVTLYESRLAPTGPTYRALACGPLSGGATHGPGRQR